MNNNYTLVNKLGTCVSSALCLPTNFNDNNLFEQTEIYVRGLSRDDIGDVSIYGGYDHKIP